MAASSQNSGPCRCDDCVRYTKNHTPRAQLTDSRYNRVDGKFCSENGPLIEKVLRAEWGFDGITMSDWFGVHATVPPIKAGLDLEMPFPVFRSARLLEEVKSEAVTEKEIDARVLKMLELRNRRRGCHGEGPERSDIDEETNQLAREIATGGIVLLKNEDALPINTARPPSIALIGEFARDPVFTGGGSASCQPQYRHSPLDILQKEFPHGVKYASGVRTRRIIPIAPTARLTARDGRDGVDVAYYNNGSDQPIIAEFQERASIWMLGDFKSGLKVPGSRVELSTRLVPESTGEHTLAVRCTGAFSLSINGSEVLSGPASQITTEQFIFNHILLESRVQVSMTAGESYEIYLAMDGPEKLVIGEPTPYAATFCFEEYYSPEVAIAEAVRLARESDMSIVYAGRSDQYESEGFDLEDIRMPANQTALIKSIAAVSRKTVLVLHCGNPIDVSPFVDDVDAVLNAHFPGQGGARAVVDLLTGKVCPSGRLATTWPKTLEGAPTFGNFPPKRVDGRGVQIRYAEGLAVGYRSPSDEWVRWPFGFGLSYTTFQYSLLSVTSNEESVPPRISCSVEVQNTGAVSGQEVVQLFVKPTTETVVWRPERELKAFTKVSLEPREFRSVGFEVDLEMACSYWDDKESAWRLEAGKYGVLVGDQQVDLVVKKGYVWNHL